MMKSSLLVPAFRPCVRAVLQQEQKSFGTITQMCDKYQQEFLQSAGGNLLTRGLFGGMDTLFEDFNQLCKEWKEEIVPTFTDTKQGVPGKVEEVNIRLVETLDLMDAWEPVEEESDEFKRQFCSSVELLSEELTELLLMLEEYVTCTESEEKVSCQGKLIDWRDKLVSTETDIKAKSKHLILLPGIDLFIGNVKVGYKMLLDLVIPPETLEEVFMALTDFMVWLRTFSNVLKEQKETLKGIIEEEYLVLLKADIAISRENWKVARAFITRLLQ